MNAPAAPIDGELLARFVKIVGEPNALRDAAAVQPYLVELRGLYTGKTPVVLRPGSVDEVARIMRLANETLTPIVPQGGNTGLVGGQVPDQSGRQIVLSLARLNRIRAVDAIGNTLIAEAGVILADAQAAADAVDRLFPLSLASEGSCEIGGNLSTNAGGTAVLAYGNTRELVLGVEVVLASGEVWNGLRTLRKDNTGYDLKHLFIGAEGTLGVITAAVLKLFPKPRGQSVAFVGLKSPRDALALLQIARGIAGHGLTGFELLPRLGLDYVLRHLPGARDPLAGRHEWYVLIEVSSAKAQADAEELIETIFAEGFDKGLVEDGTRAETLEQAKAIWHLRHAMSDVQTREGGSIKHDVSVPVAAVPELIERGVARVVAMVPGVRPVPFGHLGDGNLHFNFSQPVGADKQAFLARWEEVNAAVHAIVIELGGSISAEHGIGQLKRHALLDVKSPIEIALMRRVKAALDPNGILNPGKVL